jgi:hypothetical protein
MGLYGTPLTLTYTAWNTSINSGVIGDSANHTLYWIKDGAASVVTNAPAEVDGANIPGVYKLLISDAEAQCVFGSLAGKSSTPHVSIIPSSLPFEKLPNALPGTYGGLPTTDSNNYVLGISGVINNFDGLNNFNPASDTVVNVTNITTLGDSGNIAQANWEYIDRTLTTDTNINYPTSGEIAGSVWESVSANYNTAGTFGSTNQIGVPSATLDDYKATGFSTHSASDVWSSPSRTLTDAVNLSGIIAQTVWEYGTRVLTAGTNLNDIAASDVWSYVDRVLTSGTVEDIWSAAVRTLTANTNLDIVGTGDISKSVWEYSDRQLTDGYYNNIYDIHISGALDNIGSSGDIASSTWNYATRILTADTNINYPSIYQIASEVSGVLTTDHGTGAWTTANVSNLATTEQLMSVSGDIIINNNILTYNSGIINNINDYTVSSGVSLTTSEYTTIADTILERSMSNVEDTATEYTLCSLILAGLNSNVAGTTRYIKKTTGGAFVSQTVTTDASASPITGVS